MTYLLATISGLLGAALGWGLAAALTMLIGDWLGVSGAEGAHAMFAFFSVGPIGGVTGLIAGILLALRRHGHSSVRSISRRGPIVLAIIASLAAGGAWYAYEMRPGLGTSAGGTPRLDFEIRLPAGALPVDPPSRMRVELNTEHNRMPGQLHDELVRREGERPVVAGSVELYYRSGWRLLELIVSPSEPARIFDLKLAARPSHMKEFGPWRRVDFIAEGKQQPRPAGVSEAYEIRARVVYPEAEAAGTSGRGTR